MTRVEHIRLRSWFKPLQAILCLVPLLVGQTDILPGFLAIAAALEGSHTVYVATSTSRVKLQLSHERGQPGRPGFLPNHQPTNPAHHHGLATKALCILGGSAQSRADHHVCFSTSGAAESPGSQVRLASSSSAGKVIALNALQTSSFLPSPSSPLRCPHARLALPQAVQELRTTLLLI